MADKKDTSSAVNMSGSQLDITNIEDLDVLAEKIETFYKNDGSIKTKLTYNWDRNHRFLDGDQWLVFDGDPESGGIWRRLTVSRANEYIPRPVTNLIYDGYQTLKSYLIKNKPRSQVKPNTQQFKDRQAAKIAELVLETNWERLKEQANYEYAAACLITYGTVFKKSYIDNSALQIAKVPVMVQRPKIDPNTGMQIGSEEVQDIDLETGELKYDEIPLGDVNTEVVEPYRIAIDPNANDMHKIRWIMEYSIVPTSLVKELYDKKEEGYTGRVNELTSEESLSGSLQRFHELKNSSGVRHQNSLDALAGKDSGSEKVLNSVVLKEYYERPSQKYPKGRYIVVANHIPLYVGDSPYEGSEQGDWHPYSECRWEIVPGRFWGKSPLDAAVEIQKRINSIDAVLVLTRKTMAIPQKLIPLTVGVEPGQWTGRPGQEIRYRPDGSGARPETIPPAGVDATVFQERAIAVQDFKNVMGNMDILKGDRPPGVTSGSAINLLQELGTGKLYPVLDRWKKFVENDQKKQLKIVSKLYKEPRESFIRMLKSKNTELSEEAISQFIGTDLYDNANVIIESGSIVPKLLAAKEAKLQEAAQAGVLDLTNPSNRIEYLRQMGISGFDTDVGPDTRRQEWENTLLDNIELSPDNQPIVLDADNDDLHIEVLSRRMKEPAFMELSAPVQQAYMQHYQEHMMAKQQKLQQAQMDQMVSSMAASPQGGTPPAATSGAPQASPLKSAGKGPTQDVRQALKTDLNVPGPGGS